ncbi:rhodanese-like domain-containing protein [Leptolyngbya sp. AN02str]|uniref:rhodanese-like domain-containing protein n=1 Tax=Leptolyngbya sp. AN02str TaxID=3423363 RepID=UPI003D31C659
MMDNNPINPENMNPETIESNAQQAHDEFQAAHEREENAVANAKDGFKENVANKAPVPTPTASVSSSRVSAVEVKTRLMWGEPGLTILDVRDLASFRSRCIQGAMSAPIDTLPDSMQDNLATKRDIYVYGSSDEEASRAAQMLRDAGFLKVAVIEGGLEAWEAIGGQRDGANSQDEPGPDAYNVVSRLKAFSEERQKEKQMQ